MCKCAVTPQFPTSAMALTLEQKQGSVMLDLKCVPLQSRPSQIVKLVYSADTDISNVTDRATPRVIYCSQVLLQHNVFQNDLLESIMKTNLKKNIVKGQWEW